MGFYFDEVMDVSVIPIFGPGSLKLMMAKIDTLDTIRQEVERVAQ